MSVTPDSQEAEAEDSLNPGTGGQPERHSKPLSQK